MHSNTKPTVMIMGSLLWLMSMSAWAALPATDTYASKAAEIVAAFNERQPSTFDQSVDADSILSAVFKDLYVDGEWKRKFSAGLRQAIETELGKKIISQMPANAGVKLLRLEEENGIGLALLRIDYGDQGNSYMDLHLEHKPDGTVRVVDWFDYTNGQRYTETLRQAVATLSPTPTVLGKVFDIATDRKEKAEVLSHIFDLKAEQKYEELVRYFLGLDKAYHKSRLLSVNAAQAAGMTDDMELYGQALAILDRYNGNDPSVTFLLLDFYFLEGRYDDAQEALSRLESSFGTEDASLSAFRANAYFEAGDYAKAEAAAAHAIELEPAYEYGYWPLLLAQLELQHFSAAVNTAAVLEDRFAYDLGPASLEDDAQYAAFIQSEAYRNWRKKR